MPSPHQFERFVDRDERRWPARVEHNAPPLRGAVGWHVLLADKGRFHCPLRDQRLPDSTDAAHLQRASRPRRGGAALGAACGRGGSVFRHFASGPADRAVAVLGVRKALIAGRLLHRSSRPLAFRERRRQSQRPLLFEKLLGQQGDIDHGAFTDPFGRQVSTFHPAADHYGFVAHADPLGELRPRHQWRGAVQLLRVKTFRIHPLYSTISGNIQEPAKGIYFLGGNYYRDRRG